MNEPVVLADKQLAKMTKSVNTKLTRFEKLFGQAQEQAIEIGQELTAIRSFIQEKNIAGGFDGWLRTSFRWSRSQAYRLIDVAAQFGHCPNLGHFDTSALYLLAAPGTPENAHREATEIAEQGGFVDHETANEIIKKHKTAPGEQPNAVNERDDAVGSEKPQVRKPTNTHRTGRRKYDTWEYLCRGPIASMPPSTRFLRTIHLIVHGRRGVGARSFLRKWQHPPRVCRYRQAFHRNRTA